MADEIETLLMLDSREKRSAGSIDIADDVMRTLQQRASTEPGDHSFAWAAVASWTVAIACAVVLQQTMASFHDPFASLLWF